jgi:hypothetical protein
MSQYGQVRVHEPFDAILYAALLLAGEFARRYRTGNALLEAGFGELVNSCKDPMNRLAEWSPQFRVRKGLRGERFRPNLTSLDLRLLVLVLDELLEFAVVTGS